MVKRLALLLLPLTISAQSIIGSTPNTNQTLTERKEFTSLEPHATVEAVNEAYIIGPGDYFEIIADQISLVAQVSPEGNISINRIGMVNVKGLSLQEAKTKITTHLSKRFNPARTSVQLVKQRIQMIGVFGAVNQPNYVIAPSSMRLSEIIRRVGGFATHANIDAIKVIRDKKDTIIIDYFKIINDGKIENDIYLNSGDYIFVPKIDLTQGFLYLLVNGNPTPIPWIKDRTIYSYLERNKLLDNPTGFGGVYWAKSNQRLNITLSEAKNSFPAAGDTIDILQNFGNIYVGGQVQKSGPQPYIPNAKPITYIYNAGTSIMADQLDKIRVVRANGKYEYIDPVNGQIFPGDYIELDMSNLDYANKWTPIIGSVLGTAGLMWQIYYVTIWQPKNK
jgi:protein involved in polysaccharide export with SLBB domain